MKDMSGASDLTHAECLHLMGTATVGRIVFTEQALPAVMPVGFVLADGDVVIPVPRDSRLVTATRGAIVAFEVDDLDAGGRPDWSVTAVGRARVVRDPGARARETLPAWTVGADGVFIRVSCQRVKSIRGGQAPLGGYGFAA